MKYIKIILAAALALTMTACSDTNTAEVTTIPDVETTESVTTASEETTAETEETTTAETTTISETEEETSAETTAAETSENEDSGILDLSNYSGNFYDWELVEDMTVYDKSNFPVGEDVIERAIEAVRKSENFNRQKEEFEADENIDDEKKKAAFDENGEAIINFNSGVYEDFDGDGKKEAFFILESYLIYSGGDEKIIYTVFANSDGEIELLEEYPDRANFVFRAIRYNNFMHMYIYYSSNVGFSTYGGIIYAVDNGKVVPAWDVGFNLVEKVPDSAFIYASRRQINGYNLCFWNDEIKKYCSLADEALGEDNMKILSEIAANGDFKNPHNFKSIGGKYYSFRCGVGDTCQTYEKINGEFVESDIRVLPEYYIEDGYDYEKMEDSTSPIPVKGININEAESKAIPIT